MTNIRRSLAHPRLFTAIAAACCSMSCNEPGPRVYTAMPFDSEAQCLGPYQPLGLVDADELPANCQPVCLLRQGTLYVSEVCAPYPAQATVVGQDSADCVAALAIFGMDGGSCAADKP